MPVFSPTQAAYRTATGYRVFLAVAVPLMILGLGYGAFAIWQNPRGGQGSTLALVAGMLLAIVFLAYSLVAAFKSSFIIADDRVIEQNVWPFSSKELLLKEIAGFRTNDKYTTIFPVQADLPKLKIAYTTEAYHDLQFWLGSRYPDLDLTEAEETKATLLADDQLGGTPEERAAQLVLATRVSMVVNGLGGAVAAWLFFQPQPYRYAIAAGIAVPLLAGGALWLFPRLMRLETGKNSPHASIGIALLLPSFILVVRALTDTEPLQYATAWPIVGAVAAGFALLLVGGSWHSLLEYGTIRRGSIGEWLLLVMCAVAYGFGATLTGNAAFDDSRPTLYQTQVLDKHSTSGKTTSYYLQLGPWGPRKASDDVSVSAALYARKTPGEAATVAVRAGWLGIPWFRVEEQ